MNFRGENVSGIRYKKTSLLKPDDRKVIRNPPISTLGLRIFTPYLHKFWMTVPIELRYKNTLIIIAYERSIAIVEVQIKEPFQDVEIAPDLPLTFFEQVGNLTNGSSSFFHQQGDKYEHFFDTIFWISVTWTFGIILKFHGEDFKLNKQHLNSCQKEAKKVKLLLPSVKAHFNIFF